jgi:DNA-directed RNA polymerase specialized sigma24 family protein
MNESAQPADFPTTPWSRVAHAVDPAAPEARDALAELCGAYWYPIYAYIRRKGHDPDAALDLTQDYFTRLLETDVLASADHRRGRFRAFLRTDCGFFLSHHQERCRALKRGGRAALPIDARDAEGRYLREPADATTPERLFDQSWALNLLDEVMRISAPGWGRARGRSSRPCSGFASGTGRSSARGSPRRSRSPTRPRSTTSSAICSPRSRTDRKKT